MIFQVLLAVSEFKDKSNSYYHSRVISLEKGVDKMELLFWNYTDDEKFPNSPGIWKLKVWKVAPEVFVIVNSEMVYDIGLES